MELDDLKLSWQHMERELQAQRRITATLLAEHHDSRIQASLKPLFNGQVFQIIAGIILAAVAGQFWVSRMDHTLLLVSGLIVHVYGVALIINGIRVVLRLREIDYGASITTLQKRVARLERSYVLSGWILGLPWWLLWIPMALVVMTLAGVDVSRTSPENWVVANIGIGILGMVLTVIGFQWARRSSRPGVRAQLGRMVSGASIDNAKRLLVDIERFEREVDRDHVR